VGARRRLWFSRRDATVEKRRHLTAKVRHPRKSRLTYIDGLRYASAHSGLSVGTTSVQGRKSLGLCRTLVLRNWCFDSVSEPSEFPDHSRCVPLLRLLGNGWAAFFVTNALVQDQPDQPTLSVGNGPDGLIMPEARDRAPVHNFEDTTFGLCSGVSSLVE